VLAAGRGDRLRSGTPKAFVHLAGRPLLAHALEALASSSEIDRVVPVVAQRELGRYAALAAAWHGIPKLAPPVTGGLERQDSVRAGLASLPAEITFVAVHDAARPLVRGEDVSGVVAAARLHGAALLAVPATDTIKRVRAGRVVETPPRAECWVAQTPQAFRVEILREALAKAEHEGVLGTDDTQLVEQLGVAVHVVEGDSANLKVTRPEDLLLAEALLEARAHGRGA